MPERVRRPWVNTSRPARPIKLSRGITSSGMMLPARFRCGNSHSRRFGSILTRRRDAVFDFCGRDFD